MVTVMGEINKDSTAIDTDEGSRCSMENGTVPVKSLSMDIAQRGTPINPRHTNTFARQNQVGTVLLHGVPIVSLFIDNKERLCLAQISNTLLKNYSYNEIHNRRVALGITCVQCTPVQLEILRRAGAMPISSRRCGMITHREAERLVKSFLEDTSPPKLPENFFFDVVHECGWGCRGQFEPSRYNSSRAKCIKCSFCNVYFSPNKFIFHFHRTQDAKYNHPDAANFNSWRRHLKLSETCTKDDEIHAWEDVKAMFNGGNRKRVLSGAMIRNEHSKIESQKKPRLHLEDCEMNKPVYPSPYPPFPLLSLPGKPYQFGQLNHSPPFGLGLPFNKDNAIDASKAASLHGNPWGLQSVLPNYNVLWGSQMNSVAHRNMRNSMYPLKEIHNQEALDLYENCNENESSSSPGSSPSYSNSERFSAFRLVKKTDEQMSSPRIDDDQCEDSESEIDITDVMDRQNDPVEIDCDKNDCLKENDGHDLEDTKDEEVDHEYNGKKDIMKTKTEANTKEKDTSDGKPCISNELQEAEKETEAFQKEEENKSVLDLSKSEAIVENNGDDPDLTKEELKIKLKKEIDSRKKIERDILQMKETFKEEVSREQSYRDEVAQQLQLVRDALTNELEQERQVRFSLQQKLKEAHDALHNFSCKMLASRQCDECTYKEGETPR